jgi:hypothetical protein
LHFFHVCCIHFNYRVKRVPVYIHAYVLTHTHTHTHHAKCVTQHLNIPSTWVCIGWWQLFCTIVTCTLSTHVVQILKFWNQTFPK